MTELYLIAHKVRGEPAFDIAITMTCPVCDGTTVHCEQCDGQGEWWIIPTSGHRAFPYWSYMLERCLNVMFLVDQPPTQMPPDLRDHYAVEREVARSLVDVLGLIHKPLAPIKRRF